MRQATSLEGICQIFRGANSCSVQPFFTYCTSKDAFVHFSIELVENIPDDLSLPMDGRPHLPLSVGFHTLLDQAKHSVEVVSPVWALNPWDLETMPNTAKQVQSHSILYIPLHSRRTRTNCISLVSCKRKCNYFPSKCVWRLLMRLVLPRCKYRPFKRHLETLLKCSTTVIQNIALPQGQLLFQRLLSLKSHGVKLKIASSLTNSAELKTLAAHSEWLSYFQFIKAIFYATVASQNGDL